MSNKIKFTELARRLVWVVSFAIALLMVFYVVPNILSNSFKLAIQNLPLWIRIVTVSIVLIIGTIGTQLLIYLFALSTGYVDQVDNWLTRRFRKRRDRLTAKIIDKQKEISRKKAEFRERYSLAAVYSTDKPFTFRLAMCEKILNYSLPVAKVNGIVAGIDVVDETSVSCRIDKTISFFREKEIVFSVGTSEIVIDNPYLFDRYYEGVIEWQCEGHSEERLVLLPRKYFPQVYPGPVFEFEMKIESASYKTTGSFNPHMNAVVVNVPFFIRKAQCKGKEKTLILNMAGTKAKIALPEPKVIWVNGRPV